MPTRLAVRAARYASGARRAPAVAIFCSKVKGKSARRRLLRRLREAGNHKENRRDRRLAENQRGKRRVVVIVRERNGIGVPAVFSKENEAV